jgi:hypothetical protein
VNARELKERQRVRVRRGVHLAQRPQQQVALQRIAHDISDGSPWRCVGRRRDSHDDRAANERRRQPSRR